MKAKASTNLRKGRIHRLVGDVFHVLLGRYSQFVVTVVTVPLVARALGVEKTGQFAVGSVSVFLGSIFVDWGLTQVLAARLAQGRAGTGTVRSYRKLRWILVLILVGALAASAADGPTSLATLALMGALAGGISSLNEDWTFIGRKRFGQLALIQILGRLVYFLTVPWLIWLVPEPWLPLAVLIVANWISFVASRRLAMLPTTADLMPLGRLVRDGRAITAGKFLTAGYGIASTVLYAPMVDGRTLGLFSSADRVVRAGQSALDAFTTALLPRAARLHRDDASAIASRVPQIAGVALLAGAGAGAVLAVSSPWLVPLVFGDAFREAVPFFQIQAAVLPATAVTSALTMTVLLIHEDHRGIFFGSLVGAVAWLVGAIGVYSSTATWRLSIAVVATEAAVALWTFGRCLQIGKRAG